MVEDKVVKINGASKSTLLLERVPYGIILVQTTSVDLQEFALYLMGGFKEFGSTSVTVGPDSINHVKAEKGKINCYIGMANFSAEELINICTDDKNTLKDSLVIISVPTNVNIFDIKNTSPGKLLSIYENVGIVINSDGLVVKNRFGQRYTPGSPSAIAAAATYGIKSNKEDTKKYIKIGDTTLEYLTNRPCGLFIVDSADENFLSFVSSLSDEFNYSIGSLGDTSIAYKEDLLFSDYNVKENTVNAIEVSVDINSVEFDDFIDRNWKQDGILVVKVGNIDLINMTKKTYTMPSLLCTDRGSIFKNRYGN